MTLSYQKYLTKNSLITHFKHGHFDRLSSIYSIINAIRWVSFETALISEVGANMLFQHILSKLDRTHQIGDLGLFQIGMPEWAYLLKNPFPIQRCNLV